MLCMSRRTCPNKTERLMTCPSKTEHFIPLYHIFSSLSVTFDPELRSSICRLIRIPRGKLHAVHVTGDLPKKHRTTYNLPKQNHTFYTAIPHIQFLVRNF